MQGFALFYHPLENQCLPQAIQAGIDAGIFQQVVSKQGHLLAMARRVDNGQIAGHAIGAVADYGIIRAQYPFGGIDAIANLPFQPLPLKPLIALAQGFQAHRGFQESYKRLQTIKNMVGVLQASTALIGVGTVAGVALSAVNPG